MQKVFDRASIRGGPGRVVVVSRLFLLARLDEPAPTSLVEPVTREAIRLSSTDLASSPLDPTIALNSKPTRPKKDSVWRPLGCTHSGRRSRGPPADLPRRDFSSKRLTKCMDVTESASRGTHGHLSLLAADTADFERSTSHAQAPPPLRITRNAGVCSSVQSDLSHGHLTETICRLTCRFLDFFWGGEGEEARSQRLESIVRSQGTLLTHARGTTLKPLLERTWNTRQERFPRAVMDRVLPLWSDRHDLNGSSLLMLSTGTLGQPAHPRKTPWRRAIEAGLKLT